MQSKLHSFYESLCNNGSGFMISFLFQMFAVLPQILWMEANGFADHEIAMFTTIQFTIISQVRSYFWRRYWNWITVRELQKQHPELFNTVTKL